MPIYIKVKVEAVIKIQDPYDEGTIEAAMANVELRSPDELIDEKYEFKVEDVT